MKTLEDFGHLDQNHDGYLTFGEFTADVCKSGRYEGGG
jgi:hypothetical protein